MAVQSLVLGTAQWGSDYGITNSAGRLSDAAVSAIVQTARRVGIAAIDTAAAYGDAEKRLSQWAGDFAVTTKVRGVGPSSVRAQLLSSLATAGLTSVHACLVHDWPTLTDDEAAAAVRQLRACQGDGLAGVIGVSAYEERDLDRAIASFGTVGAVQVPVNALDRRLDGSRAIHDLRQQGAEIQARSVLLQGLLARRTGGTLGAHRDVLAFHDGCDAAGVTGVEAAVTAIRAVDWVSHVVVGATSAGELEEIARAWRAPLARPVVVAASMDLDLIDPRRWA